MQQAISTSELSHLVLKNVTAQTSVGQVCCVLGNNGAGKTTLLQLCAGLLRPRHGKVTVAEKNIFDFTEVQRAQLVAWLPQHLRRDADFSVLQFLALSQERVRIADGRLKFDKHYESHLLNSLESFNVSHLAHCPLAQLSGGEWKRVQLAHVWARGAKHLILDEPSEGLDLSHTKLLAKHCKTYAKQGSILLTTHDFAFAFSIADKFIILEKGEVIWAGERTALLSARQVLEKNFGVTFSWVLTQHGSTEMPVPEY